ncbi:hypothetical protein IG631_24231, partial [Alternaria alternata]
TTTLVYLALAQTELREV